MLDGFLFLSIIGQGQTNSTKEQYKKKKPNQKCLGIIQNSSSVSILYFIFKWQSHSASMFDTHFYKQIQGHLLPFPAGKLFHERNQKFMHRNNS